MRFHREFMWVKNDRSDSLSSHWHVYPLQPKENPYEDATLYTRIALKELKPLQQRKKARREEW